MKQESKKKLEKIIEKGKSSFTQKEEKRPFKQLMKIKPQEMNNEEKFQFIEDSLENENKKFSFDILIEIFDLFFQMKDNSIANNQASRKLNQIILKLQKEMK